MTMFKKENFDPWPHLAPPSPTPGLQSKNPIQYISYLICKNTKKFGIKIFEIDFAIEVNDIWPFDPPQGHRGRGQIYFAVTHPINVSSSQTKFGIGLALDSIMVLFVCFVA